MRHNAWLLASFFSLAGCEWLADLQTFDREAVPVFERSAPAKAEPTAQLKVMAWNVKYGAGRIPFWFDCWGDRSHMTGKEVDENLARLYALINEINPDILMTEEIEVSSRRSAYRDMVQGILENTGLNYAAYFETWDSRVIPQEGVGRMNLGNALFSRYPIKKAERIRQEDRTDQDALTRTFYIHRAVGRIVVELPVSSSAIREVAAYVVHTEAYDNDGTKQRQTQQILELLKKETLPWVIGGDFNELPPVAIRKKEFLDERTKPVCSADYAQPPYTPEILQPFYDDFVPALPLAVYGATEESQRRYFTHSVLGPDERNEKGEPGFWNRTLDYLFASPGSRWTPGTSDVLQVAGQRVGGEKGVGPILAADPLRLSDHAPVVGTWEIPQ
jgi:endonuclease/exonuclease/phosphatase family metal-dependent hydrolase